MKNSLIISFISAMSLVSSFTIQGVETPVAKANLVGRGIVEFIPENYSPITTPSLILESQPVAIDTVPIDWELTPVFYLSEDKKASAILPLPDGVSLYGGGEVTGPLLRNGKTIKLWNTDTGAYSVENGIRLYQSHPWVMGIRNDGSAFGVLFDSSWKSSLSTLDDRIEFDTEGAPFRVYVIDRETPQEVLKGLAELTGYMEMPPRWALGYHQCRFSYDSEKRVMEIADNFRERKIPCDVIWMDIDYMDGYRIFTFDPVRFPDPASLNKELHDKGFRAVYMIDPGPKVDEDYFVYRTGTEKDVWVKRPDGSIYTGKCWPGYCAFPDFTMPNTRKWWSSLYKDFLTKGIDGVWNDMNEPAITTDEDWLPEEDKIGTMPYDTPHRGGGDLPPGPHLLYHNAYGRLMTEATRNGFMEVYPDRRPFILTRANLLGGHRYAATWTGDNWAGWDHLKLSVPMSLTLGLSGQPFSGPDIGGFLNNTEPELWANWIGFGVFLPFVRGHACAGTNDKEPWAFGKEIENSSRMAIERRYRLLPYIYTKFYEAHKTGVPLMQPIFFTDPSDRRLREEQESFLLGEDLLVVPSFARHPVLSSGIWEPVHLIEGEETDPYQASLLIRGGSIIPAGKVIQNTNENSFEPLSLIVCLNEDGEAEGNLYWDAGDGWGFKNDEYSLITFNAKRNGDKVKVKISSEEGKYDLKKEVKHVNVELLQGGQAFHGSGEYGDEIIIEAPIMICEKDKTSSWGNNIDFSVSNRPPKEERLFYSQAVEDKIEEIKKLLTNPKLAWMFENCFPNTIDTTVCFRKDENGENDTFVYTGDIHAMWLRDSAAQVWPYLQLANEDNAIKDMIEGVIRRQLKCILIDPYANAFNDGPTGGEWMTDKTDMRPEVHERKWEIDSLCYPIRLAYEYWKITGDAGIFDYLWCQAIEKIYDTFIDQQRKDGAGKYSFLRNTERSFDTLSNNGLGTPVKPCGLIVSSFRPSDDATTLQFLVPSNFFAVSSLRKAAEILREVNHDEGLSQRCESLANEVEKALQENAVYNHPYFGKIYAYEVDGFGNHLLMDDANVPSLLSLAYLDDNFATDPVYRSTREFVWSSFNPYFFKGKSGEGIGGPHVGYDMIWPMSIMMKAFTSNDDNEIKECMAMLLATDNSTGFIHESFNADDASQYTRDWFAWQNTLFGELVLKLVNEGKLDLLNSL